MQKDGLEAIGSFVARDFGEDGVFVGTVISCSRDDADGGYLYRVKYSDGDIEDLDQEEYNYAFALKLEEDGWEVEEEVRVDEQGVGGKDVADSDNEGGDTYIDARSPMSPYERLREKNIARNQKKVEELGLLMEVPTQNSRKRRRNKGSSKKLVQKRKVTVDYTIFVLIMWRTPSFFLYLRFTLIRLWRLLQVRPLLVSRAKPWQL